MIISLLFLNLIKYSQRNVNMSHCDYIFFPFPYISYDFCFISFVSLLLKWLVVYDVSLLCELYLLSLKILIFVSFKINKFLKIKEKKKEKILKRKLNFE